jgi:hypothetical protein
MANGSEGGIMRLAKPGDFCPKIAETIKSFKTVKCGVTFPPETLDAATTFALIPPGSVVQSPVLETSLIAAISTA